MLYEGRQGTFVKKVDSIDYELYKIRNSKGLEREETNAN